MSRTNIERNAYTKFTLLVDNTPRDVITHNGYHIKTIAVNNTVNTFLYLQMYDCVAADVVIGVTIPKYVLPVPKGEGVTVIDNNPLGVEFDTAISVTACVIPLGNNVGSLGCTCTFVTTK